MENFKDESAPIETILAVGGAGTGKTAAFATLPGKKFMYIFDPNAGATLAGLDIDHKTFLPEQLDLDAVTLRKDVRDRTSRPPQPKTYLEFEKDFEQRLADGFFDAYDFIGIDSNSTFSDIVMDRIMFLNGRFGKWPEQADYTATVNTMIKIYRTFTTLGVPLYVTGHLEFKQEENSGKMINTFAFLGRLRTRMPILFSNIFQFFADTDSKGQTQWSVRSAPDRQNPYLRRSKGLRMQSVEQVTVDWSKPVVGQGLGRFFKT